MDIGKPIRRFTAVPADEPIRAPEPVVSPPPYPKREVPMPTKREREKEPA